MWFRGLFLLIIATSCPALALDGFLSLGFGHGGTALSDVTGGQDYNIQAGSGLFLTGGLIFPISPTTPHRFELQIGTGYLFQSASKDENEISWSRIPLEAIYFCRNTQENFRFGWGPIFQFNNELSGKGINSSIHAKVDNAYGWTLALEKIVKNDMDMVSVSFGLRYNIIKYHSVDFVKDADGNCLFLTMNVLWL